MSGPELGSVLSHRFAVPLCFLVRDGHLRNCPKSVWNYECEGESLASRCDEVFRAAYVAAEARKAGEEETSEETAEIEEDSLNNEIHHQLYDLLYNHFTSKKQETVRKSMNSVGEENSVDESKSTQYLSHKDGSPIFVMFGLGHQKWWKLHRYIRRVRRKARNSDKPFLFAVLTMEHQDRDPDTVVIQLGVFLIWDAKMRPCLINRCSVRGLHNCSQAFGKVIFACLNMVRWSEGEESTRFSYLGPNCCKVETRDRCMVLRSYDSSATQRSSRVYEKLKDVGVAGGQYHCNKLFEMKDERVEAGVVLLPPPTDCEGRVFTFFRYDGCLSVIAVPYFEGGHVASVPRCFVGPLDDLSALHKCNLAHADVRGFNMVHSKDGKFNSLIDYDFAGPIGEGEYPNFKFIILDGIRALGLAEEGKKLSKVADWYALGYVIFMCYDWEWRTEGDEQAGKLRKLERYSTHLILRSEAEGVEAWVHELRQFLLTANNYWAIEPTHRFAGPVERRPGNLEDAIGSPLKQQAKRLQHLPMPLLKSELSHQA